MVLCCDYPHWTLFGSRRLFIFTYKDFYLYLVGRQLKAEMKDLPSPHYLGLIYIRTDTVWRKTSGKRTMRIP